MRSYLHSVTWVVLVTLIAPLLGGCTKTVTRYRDVPRYSTSTVTVPYAEQAEQCTTLPPIVPGDNHVIAFTRLAGGDVPLAERVLEAIKLGFETERGNPRNTVRSAKYVARAQLLRNLTRDQLENMGPDAERVLRRELGVDINCTGTIISEGPPRISVEILDYHSGQIYTSVFEANSWEAIGADVAKSFFGSRQRCETRTVTKYREERRSTPQGYDRESYEATEPNISGLCLGGGLVLLLLLSTSLGKVETTEK